MRIAITGASGNGKTTLARRLEREVGLRYVEVDDTAAADDLREQVLAATEGDGWVIDATYQRQLGGVVLDRADVVVWLDLPAPLVLWRLLRRSVARRERHPIWPTLMSVAGNRRVYLGRGYIRLQSDADVDAFVQAARRRALP